MSVDFDDSPGKGLRRFLWQVVPNAAVDRPVLVPASEFLGVDVRIRMWRTIGVTLQRDCWHGNAGKFAELLFNSVVLLLALT